MSTGDTTGALCTSTLGDESLAARNSPAHGTGDAGDTAALSSPGDKKPTCANAGEPRDVCSRAHGPAPIGMDLRP